MEQSCRPITEKIALLLLGLSVASNVTTAHLYSLERYKNQELALTVSKLVAAYVKETHQFNKKVSNHLGIDKPPTPPKLPTR